jgi:DNA-nicking Smr family endonuclease
MRDAKAYAPFDPEVEDSPSAPVATQPAALAQTLKPAPAPPAPKASTPVSLDRRQTRLIATGRAEIDARLDLHGMRQHEAHMALKSFLFSAQARGARVVLIITGKGARRTPREREFSLYSDDEPGVLKRLTPRWLQEPELRPLIVSFGASSPNHGGDGALYVRLRKLR